MVVGIRRNRPSYALPWWLFAAGLCLYWLGDLYTYSFPKYILHHEVPFPSIGDAIYLAVYPVLMLGLLLLVRRRNPQRNTNTLIDAAILTLGLSLLSWVLLIAPYLHDPDAGPATQARVGRLSARGRHPAGRGHPPHPRQRPPSAGLQPADRKHRLPAGDGLRLRGDDARQHVRPSALARRRLDRLPAAMGRGRVAPFDGRAGGADQGTARPR